MPSSIAIPKPQLRLLDPAESQRPLTYYAEILRRNWARIVLLSLTLTALVVFFCNMAPPIYVGSAVIAIDRQAAPETIGDNHLLSTGDDQFMATQQNLLRADTILRPVVERYNLLEREHQLRHYWFWHYPPRTEKAVRNAPILLKHLKVERNPNTYLLTISYRDRDPRIAASVANAIADSYLRDIFDTRVKEARRAHVVDGAAADWFKRKNGVNPQRSHGVSAKSWNRRSGGENQCVGRQAAGVEYGEHSR